MKAILMLNEMPKECLLCPCYCHSEEFDNEFCKVNLQAFMSAEERDNRPEWCPLKPLPETHGKIGDIDRLYEVFKKNVVSADTFKELFDIAPAIIEADKGEKE